MYGSREQFIERYALTAGNEANICVKVKKTAANTTPEAITGDFVIVDCSEKAIAVFGDTKPVKDRLKALGGRFNPKLNHDDGKRAGWIFTIPIGTATSVYSIPRIAIHPTNPDIIFAGGDSGIKKTTDGGQTWSEVFSESSSVYQIAYNDLNSNILYATEWSAVYKSVNGGITWTLVWNSTSRHLKGLEVYHGVLYSSDASSDDNYSPLVSSKCLLKSTDGGSTWTELPLNNSAYDIGRITSFKIIDGVIYATTFQGLYRSNDLGATWDRISSDWDYYRSVDADSTKIVLGSYKSGVSIANKSDIIFKNVGVEPLSISSTNLKTNNINAIVCIGYYSIYKYEPDGDYWKSIAPPSGEWGVSSGITSFFSKTSGKLFCAKGYNLYSSTSNGENWTYLCQLPESLGTWSHVTISSDEQKIFIPRSSSIRKNRNGNATLAQHAVSTDAANAIHRQGGEGRSATSNSLSRKNSVILHKKNNLK